ncbi:MAG: hypothetical protein VXW31_10435, partial [Planctomycetota bacterium]|nr:hypothetical protein [Planctomycetota bacterium]
MPVPDIKSIAQFIALDALLRNGELPRRGFTEGFEHPVTGQPNANLGKRYDEFDPKTTAYVFVSHRWARPGQGSRGHPDDDDKSKYKLILEGLKRLSGTAASPIPEGFQIAVWLDFCCIDQDGAPSSELEQLGALISLCDLVLVPVIDHNHREWSYPATWSNHFEQYKAAGWTEYWSRAWCRVEAMLAAVKPVVDHAERATLFRGAMGNAIAAGRRPWALFGTKEQEERRPPLFLPPLANSTFDKYKPSKGRLTKETDRGLIETLEADARKDVVPIEVGYVGEKKDGKAHGRGKKQYDNGDVYEGEWKEGKKHGRGTYRVANGNVYEGEFEEDKKHGRGTFRWASGEEYEGEF